MIYPRATTLKGHGWLWSVVKGPYPLPCSQLVPMAGCTQNIIKHLMIIIKKRDIVNWKFSHLWTWWQQWLFGEFQLKITLQNAIWYPDAITISRTVLTLEQVATGSVFVETPQFPLGYKKHSIQECIVNQVGLKWYLCCWARYRYM